MTIDSQYFAQYGTASASSVYGTNLESIGAEALEFWVYNDIEWTYIAEGSDLEYTFGPREPIYSGASAQLLQSAVGLVLPGYTTAFTRRTSLFNPVLFVDGEEFDGNAFEYGVDVLTMICQELQGNYVDCGEFQTSEGEPPVGDPCLVYSCSALSDAQAAIGTGVWELLDPNDGDTIPATLEPLVAYPGSDLITIDAGDDWDTGLRYDRNPFVAAKDINHCSTPAYFMSSNYNNGNWGRMQLSPPKVWGSSPPNAYLSIVLTNPRVAELGNTIWRSAINTQVFRQTGSVDNAGWEKNVAIVRVVDQGTTYDAVWFNYGKASADWQALFPEGFFIAATLVEFYSYVSNIEYVPSSYQGGFYSSYDMMVTEEFWVRATQKDGNSVVQSKTLTYNQYTCYDPDQPGDAENAISDSAKMKNRAGNNTNYFMTGGITKFYNFSLSQIHNGETSSVMIEVAPPPDGIGSDLRVDFQRSFADYVDPNPTCIPP